MKRTEQEKYERLLAKYDRARRKAFKWAARANKLHKTLSPHDPHGAITETDLFSGAGPDGRSL